MKDRLVKYRRSSFLLLLPGILAISLLTSTDRPGDRQSKENTRIMFYNVENLFDTLDSDLDDDEFLPWGLRRWNRYKYRTKLNNLSKVIIAVGGWSPPAIIGLCEVENANVLSDLLSTSLLKDIGYHSLYSAGADRRGIGVALLYSKDFSLIDSRSIFPLGEDGDTLLTRSVLYAKFASRKDTLSFVVTHWPSRRGGVSATDRYRERVAEQIRKQVLKLEKEAKLILMGDFNCEPDSYIITEMIKALPGGAGNQLLDNPSLPIPPGGPGTYKYQGRWFSYDQIMFSKELVSSEKGYQYLYSSFTRFNKQFLLTDDRSYRGMKPLSTWAGPRYIGGYSDHLPVRADLVYKD